MLVILICGFYGVVYLGFTYDMQFRLDLTKIWTQVKKSRILFKFMKFFDIGMMHIPLGGMFIAVYRKLYRAPSMTVCGTRLLLLIEDVDETTGAGSALGLLAIDFNK